LVSFFLFVDMGFEELTAICQWHIVRFRLDGIGSLQFFPRKELAPNPIIHPRKTGGIFGYLLFLYGFRRIMGLERPLRKQSGGLFSVVGESHGTQAAALKSRRQVPSLCCTSFGRKHLEMFLTQI